MGIELDVEKTLKEKKGNREISNKNSKLEFL